MIVYPINFYFLWVAFRSLYHSSLLSLLLYRHLCILPSRFCDTHHASFRSYESPSSTNLLQVLSIKTSPLSFLFRRSSTLSTSIDQKLLETIVYLLLLLRTKLAQSTSAASERSEVSTVPKRTLLFFNRTKISNILLKISVRYSAFIEHLETLKSNSPLYYYYYHHHKSYMDFPFLNAI